MVWNQDLIKKSGGSIPPLGSNIMGYSIGSSHTTVFMRQMLHKSPCNIAGMADPAGKLDADRLATGKPAFQAALQHGWTWKVDHWQLEEAVPKVLDFIQTSLNIEAKGERTEVEVVTSMWADASAMEDGGGVDWKQVIETQKKRFARQQSGCQH